MVSGYLLKGSSPLNNQSIKPPRKIPKYNLVRDRGEVPSNKRYY